MNGPTHTTIKRNFPAITKWLNAPEHKFVSCKPLRLVVSFFSNQLTRLYFKYRAARRLLRIARKRISQ